MPSQLPSQTFPHHHHHYQYHCFPLLHRHHHHHLLFTKFDPSPVLCPCPLHHNHHHHHHFNSCSSNLHLLAINPRIISSIPPNPGPIPAGFLSGCPTVSTAVEDLFFGSGVQPMDQSEVLKLEDPGEEEELEDVFVLTDEWREFFAKSEAKRRMDKQQKNEHKNVQPMDQSEVLKLEDPGEEEELEDVFVLTDEWREFFTKSEAKRRMDKQQKNEHKK